MDPELELKETAPRVVAPPPPPRATAPYPDQGPGLTTRMEHAQAMLADKQLLRKHSEYAQELGVAPEESD